MQLPSGSPGDTRALHEWARARNIAYLGGCILAFPSQLGLDEAQLLVGGDREAYDRSESILRTLAPPTEYLREDSSRPVALDRAVLSIGFEARWQSACVPIST